MQASLPKQPRPKQPRHEQARSFSFRAGVRVRDTILACDASAGSDLVFLSHARALDARDARALPRPRSGRRQVLTTETTLALLGAAGDRLRGQALLASYGRPFALGGLRLELFPSGHMPGAASLLCEAGGRRLVYAGAVGPAGAAAVRSAEALCLRAPFGARRFTFPDRAEGLAQVRDAAVAAAASGRTPVLLVDPFGPALEAGAALEAGGLALRAHRRVMAAAVAFRRAGLAAPALQRFDGRLRAGEALLWPADAAQAPMLRALTAPPPAIILASAWAVDPEAVARVRADRAVPLSSHADFAGLIRYVESTGAAEVALMDAPGDELAQALRARGVEAYSLGPPRQTSMFGAGA